MRGGGEDTATGHLPEKVEGGSGRRGAGFLLLGWNARTSGAGVVPQRGSQVPRASAGLEEHSGVSPGLAGGVGSKKAERVDQDLFGAVTERGGEAAAGTVVGATLSGANARLGNSRPPER